MRTIKFRGLRDTENGGTEMVHGNVLMDSNQDCAYHNTHPDRISWRTETGGHASAPVRKGTVGQFTGLHDKNGKEIYEGDILEVRSLHDGHEQYWNQPSGSAIPAIVEWDDKYKCFICPLDSYNFEIIGNIYENPNLLHQSRV